MAIDIQPVHPLTSRACKNEDTVIEIRGHKIGGGTLTLIGGPCSVESADQVMTVAKSIKEAGGQVLRGGAFKPRTSPYSFQGMGGDGLRILKKAGVHNDIPVITEIMSTEDFDEVERTADICRLVQEICKISTCSRERVNQINPSYSKEVISNHR